MDLSSVLAYKSLFFATRAKRTAEQLEDGKTCTAVANGARCAITTSQAIVPLFAVSECLARTAQNPKIAKVAENLAGGNLKKIALAVSGNTTQNALSGLSSGVKFFSRLGLAGNLAYAAAKCLDADEDNKTEVFLQAAGNCAGMYLFENLYAKAVKVVKPGDIDKSAAKLAQTFNGKIPLLKSVKLSSILLGVGFVAASLLGCKAGELLGQSIYNDSKAGKLKKERLALNSQQNVKNTA